MGSLYITLHCLGSLWTPIWYELGPSWGRMGEPGCYTYHFTMEHIVDFIVDCSVDLSLDLFMDLSVDYSVDLSLDFVRGSCSGLLLER